MTLADDIAAWVAERTDWQKDVVARFCRNEVLSQDDVVGIADRLIAGTYPAIAPISANDIPGPSDTGVPVRLLAVADLDGVNALLPGQRLTFGDAGLTIIYGDNGSGKSGYARLIRRAVTARVKGDILGNVFADDMRVQKASIEYSIGGDVVATWTLADIPIHELSAVWFYDEECGDAYVTMASEISYRPSALTLLDRLSSACDEVSQVLTSRLADNASKRPVLPTLAGGTKAKQFVDKLSASTTQAEIDEATALEENHVAVMSAKLQELTRLQGSDPNAEKTRFVELATDWATVRSQVDKLEAALNAEAFARYGDLKQRAADLRAAATLASSKNFDAEPLSGVGSATWRGLWEAARQYSTVEAYDEHQFPVVTGDAACVLCQQPLAPSGADRLARFERFVSDTTSKEAADAEAQLKEGRDDLVSLMSTPPEVTVAFGRLQVGGEDVTLTRAWVAAAEGVATALVAWLDGSRGDVPTAPPAAPRDSIEARRTLLTAASKAVDATSFQTAIRDLKAEVAELQAGEQLSAAREEIESEVERLKRRAQIESVRRLTDTTGITRKATSLTTKYVTAVVRDQFTRETERLHLRKVTLEPTGGRREVTLEHRPRLLGATVDVAIHEVLSEGEQTALGLAGFLTEVEFDESKSAVVLDDPVSSLDAGRRSRVASRLVELAQSRQVIVFTHEATFVNVLNKVARDLGVDVVERAIMRQGERPGLASDKHPWSVKDIPARIHDLEADLARLKRERADFDSEAYTRRAQEWGGRLSQAWERAVNMDVVNELVDRGTNEVRPRMFKMLVGITEQDNNDYQSGYAKASEWAPRHDQAPETNFIAPEPDELEAELVRFKGWVKRIKDYKK